MVRLRDSWRFNLSSAPTVGNPCRPLQPESVSRLRQSLLQVEQKILFVLDSDRQTQRPVLDPEASAIGRGHAAVRGRGRMGDERARLADVDEMREQAEPLQSRARGRLA